MRACMFPGQGTQQVGMGADLFERFPAMVSIASEILGYSIQELCLNNPENRLRETQFTQPAVFMVNAMSYTAHREETNGRPDYVLGHSLGELNALWAAGVFDFSTAMKIVQKRGELMARASGGAMAAIIGLTEAEIRKVIGPDCLSQIDIANLNTRIQVVLSGTPKAVHEACERCEEVGAKVVKLNVSAAFHSRFMAECSQEFEQYLAGVNVRPLSIPVIANATAQPYAQNEIKEMLVRQLREPVRWYASIRYVESRGVTAFVEPGHGRVLSRMLKQMRRDNKKTSEMQRIRQACTEQPQL